MMKTTSIVIWLFLLTVYIGYEDFAMSKYGEAQQNNLEKRKAIFANFNERFEKIETFINEDIMPRFQHTEKYLHEH